MLVKELIDKLKEMPQDKIMTCQVVAQNGDVWSCGFDVKDIKSSRMVNIKVSHHEITHLPNLKDKVN